ncbi:MAG: isoprenylcysteine carboxylmethyltransferase family protein [Clostridia bacterium]|nr:isoprenylcysteine carboxylmethyltransferase family protein [Clostridia bacterium]
MKLFIRALLKFIFGFLLLSCLLFLPAGTLAYPNAWLFLGLLFTPMLIMGIVLFLKAPKLLEKRLNGKEKESSQKGVLALSALMFPLGFILSALDFRFAWSDMPKPLVIAGSILFLIGYAMYAEVMRENAYLSRTVEVQKDQKVIDTGLYGVIRHPMYFATLLMFLPMPIVLGSVWGLLPFALYPIILVIRIRNEETVLSRNLPGYTEYRKKVKYRLIPFIW